MKADLWIAVFLVGLGVGERGEVAVVDDEVDFLLEPPEVNGSRVVELGFQFGVVLFVVD